MRAIIFICSLLVSIANGKAQTLIPSQSLNWGFNQSASMLGALNPQIATAITFSKRGQTAGLILQATIRNVAPYNGATYTSSVGIQETDINHNWRGSVYFPLPVDFAPEDVSIINYLNNDEFYVLVTGKKLTLTGYDFAVMGYIVYPGWMTQLSWTTIGMRILDTYSGRYDPRTDDIVRIEDDGSSRFAVVFNNNNEIKTVTGELQPGQFNLNQLNTIFPNGNYSGEFIKPDISVLSSRLSRDPNNPDIAISCLQENGNNYDMVIVHTADYANPTVGQDEDFTEYMIETAPRVALRGVRDWAVTFRSLTNYCYIYIGPNQRYDMFIWEWGRENQLELPGPDVAAIDGRFVSSWTQYDFLGHTYPASNNIRWYGNPVNCGMVCAIVDGHFDQTNTPRYIVQRLDVNNSTAYGSSVAAAKNEGPTAGQVGFSFWGLFGYRYGSSFMKNSDINDANFVRNKAKNFTTESLRETEAKLSIYPNPVSRELRFKGIVPSGAIVSIYNYSGELINTSILRKDFIDISGLASGVYIIKITTANSKPQVLRFIKK